MATKERTEVILNLEISYKDAFEKITEYQKLIQNTKDEQIGLGKTINNTNDALIKLEVQFKKNLISVENYNKEKARLLEIETIGRKAIIENDNAIKEYQSSIRTLNKEIQNNVKIEEAQKGSLVALRAELSNLTAQYDRLSEADRNAAKGKELSTKIVALTNDIKEAEEETQRFYRNVGNYEQSILNAAAGSNKFAQTLLATAASGKTAGGAISAVTTSVKALGKQLLALLANPIVAIIAAIVAVFMLFRNAIKSSEEATARFNAILAPVGRAIDFLMKILQKLIGFVLKGVEAFGSLLMSLSRLAERLPIVGKYIKQVNDALEESVQIERDKLALDKQIRENLVENAKNERDIAELRHAVYDKENKTAKERLAAAKEANRLEHENMERNLATAKERLRIAELENSRNESTKEQLEELSQLRADMFKAEQEYFDKSKGLLRYENSIRKELAAEEKQRFEDAKKRRETELTLLRQQQDVAMSIIADSVEKQRDVINLGYDRQLEDLKRRLKEEQNLTASARASIDKMIYDLEVKRNQDFKKLDEATATEKLQNDIDREQKRIELLLAAAKEGSEQESQLRLDSIEQSRQAEINANNQLTEALKQDEALINAKYDRQIADEKIKILQETAQRQDEIINYELQTRLLGVAKGSEQEAKIRLDAAIAENERLNALTEEQRIAELGSIEAYNFAVAQSSQMIVDAQMAQQEAIRNSTQMQLEAASLIGHGFQGILEGFAEDNEALAAFAKTVAMFNIGIDTAKAIAAIPAMSAQGDPYTYALRVATGIASVLSAVAQAKRVLSKETKPKAPKLQRRAKGGMIEGAGSGTSDSIPIMASNGESVMNAMTTAMFAPLLSSLNQMGGGVPIMVQETSASAMGEDMLRNAMKQAIAEMPQPVVGVDEIQRVTNRVNVIESIGL